MKIEIRKKTDVSPLVNILEWSVNGEKFYPINRKNVLTPVNSESVPVHNQRVRQFFTCLISGLTVICHAKYYRETRQMEVML